MKVKVITTTNEYGNSAIKIFINDKREFYVSDGEPEDGNLSRNFNDCYGISDLLKMAYEAGKNGETFDVEYVEEFED